MAEKWRKMPQKLLNITKSKKNQKVNNLIQDLSNLLFSCKTKKARELFFGY